jgi:hypothetical protein
MGNYTYAELQTAGYEEVRGRVGDPVTSKPLHHKPCGGAVWDAATHDELCPANGNGRTEPLLVEK